MGLNSGSASPDWDIIGSPIGLEFIFSELSTDNNVCAQFDGLVSSSAFSH